MRRALKQRQRVVPVAEGESHGRAVLTVRFEDGGNHFNGGCRFGGAAGWFGTGFHAFDEVARGELVAGDERLDVRERLGDADTTAGERSPRARRWGWAEGVSGENVNHGFGVCPEVDDGFTADELKAEAGGLVALILFRIEVNRDTGGCFKSCADFVASERAEAFVPVADVCFGDGPAF